MLTSEAGLEISLQGPFLSVAVLLPEKFLTHTQGLLGTFNNDPADDFTLRSGEVLPPSASSRELFRFGADCKRPQAGAQRARPWEGLGGGAGSPQTLPPASPDAVFPGAVQNASSLLTYDSKFLVENFKERPKHDPTFLPLFPEESSPSPSQASAAADLCGDDSFCKFDVAATGSLSVGNASRVAHMQHRLRVQSLQPGERGGAGLGGRRGRGGGRLALGHGPPGWWQQARAQVRCLRPAPTLVVSCGWLAPPANGHKQGERYLVGSTVRFRCNNGYSLAGADASTCQADGTWSWPTPTCQPGENTPPTRSPAHKSLPYPHCLAPPISRPSPAHRPLACPRTLPRPAHAPARPRPKSTPRARVRTPAPGC